MNDNDKVKKALESAEVPRSLEPDMMRKMLDEKAPAKKRGRIRFAARAAATAAAAAVVCTGAVHLADIAAPDKSGAGSSHVVSGGSTNPTKGEKPQKPVVTLNAPYMNGARDYSKVYELVKKQCERYDYNIYYGVDEEGIGSSIFDKSPEAAATEITGAATNGTDMSAGEDDFLDTYNQEEGVLEADKAKTDGKNIYYANNGSAEVNIAEVRDGKFVGTSVLDPKNDIDSDDLRLDEMYIYNDMLVLICDEWKFPTNDVFGAFRKDVVCGSNGKELTYALFYTLGSEPTFIDSYTQEGSYKTARITPDGSLCLITDYSSYCFSDIEDENDLDAYIPKLGMRGDIDFIEAPCILLPTEEDEESSASYGFTVVGSIDLTESGSPELSDSKALAGFTGEVYCSAENLYITCGWEDTDITRISLKDGKVSPEASGKVEGTICSQFSMSEYNGFFRIATTKNTYKEMYDEEYDYSYTTFDKRDNRVYVLNSELDVVGSFEGFGEDENIRSVNFSGKLAYVVTFRQTDPLFAIDLSDPTKPVILDELKVSGFSTYMQNWTDGLLLGFGNEADADGRVTGIKLEMFDNSDPNALREAGKYIVCDEIYERYSDALYDRKQLLIAPDKNIICVPLTDYQKYEYDGALSNCSGYMIFSYEDGKFINHGFFKRPTNMSGLFSSFDRAVYIGGHIYLLSNNSFISVDMNDFTETDEAVF